jgi:integrase
VPPGERLATTDPDVATQLAADRLQELESARRRRAFHGGRAVETQLGAFARLHLIAKKKAGKVTDEWLELVELALNRAVAYFGAERELDTLRVSDVRAWIAWLEGLTTPRERRLGPGTIRHHLNALSNLYRRAQEEEVVLPGYNPVAALMEKPAGPRREARWIEIQDAALILEAARQLRPLGGTTLDAAGMARLRSEWDEGQFASLRAVGRAYGVSDVVVGRILRGEQVATEPVDDASHAHVLVALFLLTGCRFREVAGLELDDVSFDRKTITIRPNRWRALKTRTSHRVIPMWPQLEAILRAWVFGRRLEQGGTLLVPSWTARGDERRFRDIHRLLDRVAKRAGLGAGEFRSKAFRHTYCAARLQTLDRGAPVSIYTVARELGHGSDEMVKRIYAHLGDVRHRAEVVEYRVEQHLDRLGDRLQRLGSRGSSDTGKDTVAEHAADARNPDSTEVPPGEKLPESGRPDSNRRRPAWEAGILPLNYARESRLTREVNVPGPLAGVKRSRRASDQPRSPRLRAPARPPESSGDPARLPPALPGRHCPAGPPASTAPGPRPARTGGRTNPR